MSWSDPIVDEVRRIRDEYAARFNYDVEAMVDDIRKRALARRQRLTQANGTGATIPGPTAERTEPVVQTDS